LNYCDVDIFPDLDLIVFSFNNNDAIGSTRERIRLWDGNDYFSVDWDI